MKKKVLLTSILSIVCCLSLIAGATLALFTSESKVDIAISSGEVKVSATVDTDSIKTFSGVWNSENNAYESGEQQSGKFANGGSARFEGGKLTLDRMTPMDRVTFRIDVVNGSTVAVLYRMEMKDVTDLKEGEVSLLEGLTIGVKDAEADAYTYLPAYDSGWTKLEAGEKPVSLYVSVEFPDREDNDAYQGAKCDLAVAVRAIQGNAEVAPVVSDAAGFVEQLADSEVSEIELAPGTFEFDAGLTINRPVTISGAGKYSVLKFGSGPAVSGQANLMIASEGVTLKNLSVEANDNSNPDVSAVKIMTSAAGRSASETVPVRLENVWVSAGAGHAVNAHGAGTVVIDGCTLNGYAKCGISVANIENITVGNTVFGNAEAWSDIGLMYDATKPADYENPSRLKLGAGNRFAKKLIYSERPKAANGGKDVLEGREIYAAEMNFFEIDAGWAFLSAAHVGDRGYPTIQAAVDAAVDGDTVRISEGVFFEAIDLQGKSVTLQGAGKEKTFVCGPATYSTEAFPHQTWAGWGGGQDATVYAIISADKDVVIRDLTVSAIPEQISNVQHFRDQSGFAFVGIHVQNADAVIDSVDIQNVSPAQGTVTGNDHHNFGLYITSDTSESYTASYTNGTVSGCNRGAIYCWSGQYQLTFENVTVVGPGFNEADSTDPRYAFCAFYVQSPAAYSNVKIQDVYRVADWGGASWNWNNNWYETLPGGVICENCGSR